MSKPILFSEPMIKAIQAGTKTQTRRAVKGMALEWLDGAQFTPEFVAHPDNGMCKYGQPGDQLYVKETFYAFGYWEKRFSEKKGRTEWHFVDKTLDNGYEYVYAADVWLGDETALKKKRKEGVFGLWKRPAIFMPRVASRYTIVLENVRVERLHGISESDAKAEGAEPIDFHKFTTEEVDLLDYPLKEMLNRYRNGFAFLWETINGNGSWELNHWLWVLAFKLEKK